MTDETKPKPATILDLIPPMDHEDIATCLVGAGVMLATYRRNAVLSSIGSGVACVGVLMLAWPVVGRVLGSGKVTE